jgi:hypothetical protein
LPKSLGNDFVFFFVQMPEEIPRCRIGDLSPRIVSPELVHAFQVCCVNTFGMPPQNVSIYVGNREV